MEVRDDIRKFDLEIELDKNDAFERITTIETDIKKCMNTFIVLGKELLCLYRDTHIKYASILQDSSQQAGEYIAIGAAVQKYEQRIEETKSDVYTLLTYLTTAIQDYIRQKAENDEEGDADD